MTTKTCRKCGQEKDLAAFHRNRNRPDGLQDWCRACGSAHQRKPGGRAIRRKAQLKWRFGITPEQYDAILDKQGGVCAICGNSCPSGRRLSVDHSHVTGQVRGLLCVPCNKALGGLRDSHVLLAKAAAYLTRPPAREILAPLDDSTTEK